MQAVDDLGQTVVNGFGVEKFLDVGYTLFEVRRYMESLRITRLGLELFPDSTELKELLERISSRQQDIAP